MDERQQASFCKRRNSHYVEVETCTSRHRKILKNGEVNVQVGDSTRIYTRYLRDFITTLVDMKWRWVLLILNTSFFSSWFLFAVLWWIVIYRHGDLEPDHLPQSQSENGWTPCVTGIYNFTSIFMLSMENQHTTGFGARMPTEECPEAIFMMCIQAIVGVTMQSVFVGIVFAKLIRPKQRTNTLLFSHRAVICRRHGKLCLVARIGDLCKSKIIECKVVMQLITNTVTPEGEELSPTRTNLRLVHKQNRTHFILLWPEFIVHVIDKDSPLYELSASNLEKEKFEIVVFLEGTMDSTDQRVQARASYTAEEIQWGYRFCPIIKYDTEKRYYTVDYNQFDITLPVSMPLCSAKELDDLDTQTDEEHNTKNIGGVTDDSTA